MTLGGQTPADRAVIEIQEDNKFNREVKKEIPKHIEKFKRDFQQLAILCYYHDVVST